jgi:serine protease AprX
MAGIRRRGACASASIAALALIATAATAATASTAVASPSRRGTAEVLVQGLPGAQPTVVRDVRAVGGHIHRTLAILNGVSATVPVDALARLRTMPGIRAVTGDGKVHFNSVDSTLGYDVAGDEGSLYDIGQITHAVDAWKNGYTGKNVDVALIDSGVAPVQGLSSGNVLNGPDLSFESQNPDMAHLDGFGHGTHMGSIIAGRDAAASGSTYASSTSHKFNGIAPDARLISLKVAVNSGATDVSQVIAAIDWVVAHAHDSGLNIRVLNLSFGTDSTQNPAIDPLCFAVENAWRAGIVVVVASGNDGTNRQQLANPAQDPLVLAVGADDPNNTDSVGDDTVPSWAQRGTSARHVDLIAPGVHVLGLRDPGSRIDQENPNAVVGSRFFRGTGTSQAAAVVSGLSALYLQRYPSATSDQVKRVLMGTAAKPPSTTATNAGVGVPDINKALGQKPPTYSQAATGATGSGSLEQARGSAHVNDGTADLTGEQDIFGHAWDGAAWAAATSSGTAWNGGDWNGNTWTGNTWTGNTWTGNTWTGNTWTGNTWTGNTWTGNTWTGNTWTGNTWTGNTWTGNTWTDSSWGGAGGDPSLLNLLFGNLSWS